MLFDIGMLAGSLCLILFCCIVFVNAIEVFGKTLGLHQGIIGSILAAIGTALPETIIPIIAIFFARGAGAHDVGIGAIAGAPFMLATLGFFVTGAATLINASLKRRTLQMNANAGSISRDLIFFLIFYGIAVGSTIFHDQTALKVVCALVLLASYAVYLKWTVGAEVEGMEHVDDLFVSRYLHLPATLTWTVVQVALSLVLLVVGSNFFVKYVQELSLTMGISPLILSLIITPIATELPEKMNSIIWIGKKKDTLAMGNITGAMVFQSCFPVVFGMIFTHWDLRGITLVSASIALGSGLINLIWLKVFKQLNPFVLMLGGILYTFFILCVFVWMK
jgi:cation:H+ antiporter